MNRIKLTNLRKRKEKRKLPVVFGILSRLLDNPQEPIRIHDKLTMVFHPERWHELQVTVSTPII